MLKKYQYPYDILITNIVYKKGAKHEAMNLNMTKRKIQHIVLAAQGLTNKQIAKFLLISESTVKKTFEDIFKKLKVVDRASMVNKSWIYGILNKEVEEEILKSLRSE